MVGTSTLAALTLLDLERALQAPAAALAYLHLEEGLYQPSLYASLHP